MSVRTKTVAAPGRVARRVQEAERVKSGAAQRAYARRKVRAEGKPDSPALPPPRTSVMAGRIPFVTAIIALLGCGLALTLLLTTRAAEDSYQLSSARETNRKLSDERALLEREVAAADSAPDLAERARELGMIPAKDPARLVVASDGTVTVIGEPVPAEGTPAPPLGGVRTPPPSQQAGPGERVVPVTTTPPAAPSGAPAPGAQPPGAPAPAPVVGDQAHVPPAPAPLLDLTGPRPGNSAPQLSESDAGPDGDPAPQPAPAPIDDTQPSVDNGQLPEDGSVPAETPQPEPTPAEAPQ
ncbi:FtsB family cell division protein [Nocardia callitridis]|uniref:Cell division protein FtsL n=1 Tax=Nocardia callitridis TaxID=648753 RepID=A0ABP9KJL0_9NOCA